jgi:hypothetical protein
MFVLWTAAIVWLGWDLSLVRRRQEFLRRLDSTGQMFHQLDYPLPAADYGRQLEKDVEQIAHETFGPEPFTRIEPRSTLSISKVRRWMGDKPILYVAYWAGPDTDMVRRMFPEAIVVVADRPYAEAAKQYGWRPARTE